MPIYKNFLSGTLSADPGTSGTTLNASNFASLPVITAPDTMRLVLDPDGDLGNPEVVLITAHSASATSVTVTRAQESTTGIAHAVGTVWRVAPTAADFDELPYKKLTARGDVMVATAAGVAGRLAVGSASTVLKSDGNDPSWGQIVAANIASDAVTTAKILDANVTTAKIADDAITAAKIATDAVGSAEIAAGAVGTSELADAGVTAAKLASAVAGDGLAGGAGSALSVNVDGSTIEIVADTLQVKDAGITAAKLAAAVAGNGLAGGAGSALSVNVDNSTLEINADTLRVKDGGVTTAKLVGVMVSSTGANRTITVSSSAASGTPADGDIWIKY